MRKTTALLAMVAGMMLSIGAWGARQGPDKNGYHLFNPTPRDQLRPFLTDRPDKTESAYTVDAGHFAFETDLFAYTYRKQVEVENGVTTTTVNRLYSFNLINLKVGLTNWSDFQLIAPTFNVSHEKVNGTLIRRSGYADTLLRFKASILGNDDGPVAFAAMPFIKLPTNADGLGHKKIEGGIAIPAAARLPRGWNFGTMLQYDRAKNERDEAFHSEFASSYTIDHDLVGTLNAYGELFTRSSTEKSAGWVATFDMGLTWMPSPDVQFDTGVNIGLTDAADDWNPFLGLSVRW